MNEILKNKCDQLIGNRMKLENEFKFSNNLMNIAAALVFTGAKREIDVEKLKEARKIVKDNLSIFSSFRGTAEPLIVCKMALSNDPYQFLNDVKIVYDKFSKGLFSDSGYIIQAAISIVDAGMVMYADTIKEKFKELYKRMGKEHPLITSSSDIVFAVMLCMTDKSVDTIIREMETCYHYLKKEVKIGVGGNEIQGLSEVLTLSDGDMKEKCDKVVNIYGKFWEKKHKYGAEYNEFASLGCLIDLDVDTDILVNNIIEAAEYLKQAKGFGSWSLNKKQRLLFAAMLAADVYSVDSNKVLNSAVNSTVAIIIAEEVALIMCMMMITVASSSNH